MTQEVKRRLTVDDVCNMIREVSPQAELTLETSYCAKGTFGRTCIAVDIALERDEITLALYFSITAFLNNYEIRGLELTFNADSPQEYVYLAIGEFLHICTRMDSLLDQL